MAMEQDTMSSCSNLAKQLSHNYRQIDPYQPPPPTRHPALFDNGEARSFLRRPSSLNPSKGESSLTSYLMTHGILLTMCMSQFGCKLVPGIDDHASSSWINQEIGVKVIPTLPPMGHILDPSLMNVTCIYPTDAMSNARDENGCGAVQVQGDPLANGSKGANSLPFWQKFLWKRQIRKYKEFNFGTEIAWEDIPCDMMLPLQPPGPMSNGIIFWDEDVDLRKESNALQQRGHDPSNDRNIASMIFEFGLTIMNHPICSLMNSSLTNITYGEENWWIYNGDASWPPEEWQTVIDLQLQLQKEYPNMERTWNEIVLDMPKLTTMSSVSAIFYLVGAADSELYNKEQEDAAKKRAQRTAKFYNKPLMVMNITAAEEGLDVLHCESPEGDAELAALKL